MSTRAPMFGGAYDRPCDFLPPPPRQVELTFQARCLRVSLLAGLLLVPNLVLWVGFSTGDDLRSLAAEGRSTSGRVLPASCPQPGPAARPG